MLNRNGASSRPAVKGANVFNHADVGFQFVQHGRDRSLDRAAYPTICFERGPVFTKPYVYSVIPDLIGGDFLIALDRAALVLSNGSCEWSVIREDRTPVPAVGKPPEASQRERLDERFLKPLA